MHPRATTHQRVLRSTGHRTLPNILGPWFERRNDPDTYSLYCASVLAALKPWRDLTDLMNGFDSWDDALEAFLLCKESADQVGDEESDNEPGEEPEDELDLRDYINGVELKQAVLSRTKQKELDHAEKAAEIGSKLGLFGSTNVSSGTPWVLSNSLSTAGDPDQVLGWTRALREAALQRPQNTNSASEGNMNYGEIEMITVDPEDSPNGTATITYEGGTASELDMDVSMLSEEQLRVFEIVRNHFLEAHSGNNPQQLLMQIQGEGGTAHSGNNPQQLLMQIQGEGGTGKSLVISKITEFFRKRGKEAELRKKRGKEAELRKSAYTGIAVSLIEESTLHQLAALHLCNSICKKTIKRLQDTWGPVNYLVIDEVSMVSKKIIAESNEVERETGHCRKLSRPPICVLVKLWRTKINKLQDLDEGVVPTVPIRNRFTLKLPNRTELTITREQLPLTPAYAFTDYRSQGQTIPYIIMDLATPPTGGLTPFNGYVTISRSRTSKTARLLRHFDDKLFTTDVPDSFDDDHESGGERKVPIIMSFAVTVTSR
ncbi:hypothetical protein RSAG8_10366, partial [Rhizoctonia solani AG-8 WAC10335]